VIVCKKNHVGSPHIIFLVSGATGVGGAGFGGGVGFTLLTLKFIKFIFTPGIVLPLFCKSG